MMLCVDGSDITRLTLEVFVREHGASNVGGWNRVQGATFDVSPEEYLASIVQFVQLEALEGIVVVVGPGSATALRASLAIANTLAMTRKIPLYGVQKGTPWESVLTNDGPKDGAAHLEPVYTAEPKITPSKKDQLRRKDAQS